MKTSVTTNLVVLAIAGIKTATARFSGFDLTCKWINYTNLIGRPDDKRSVIMKAICDQPSGRGDPLSTWLDLKACLGWDADKCNFVTPRDTADAFTEWCEACSIGNGSREGYETQPSLECDCECYEDLFGKTVQGSISLSSNIGNNNGMLVC